MLIYIYILLIEINTQKKFLMAAHNIIYNATNVIQNSLEKDLTVKDNISENNNDDDNNDDDNNDDDNNSNKEKKEEKEEEVAEENE